MKNRELGFSLIEILMVVLIIGLGVGLVALSVGGSGDQAMRINVKRFSNAMSLVSEEALLSGEQWGVNLYRDTDNQGAIFYCYRWLRLEQNKWLAMGPEGIDAGVDFPPETELHLELEGSEYEIGFKQAASDMEDDSPAVQPQIMILSSGEMTPFLLTFSIENGRDHSIRVMSDLIGRIKVEYGESRLE